MKNDVLDAHFLKAIRLDNPHKFARAMKHYKSRTDAVLDTFTVNYIYGLVSAYRAEYIMRTLIQNGRLIQIHRHDVNFHVVNNLLFLGLLLGMILMGLFDVIVQKL
jgi:hypothetical protein